MVSWEKLTNFEEVGITVQILKAEGVFLLSTTSMRPPCVTGNASKWIHHLPGAADNMWLILIAKSTIMACWPFSECLFCQFAWSSGTNCPVDRSVQ